MNIVCPNCDAEYLLHPTEEKKDGLNLQCSHCSQKWCHYNPYKLEKTEATETDSLKKMARDEYKILGQNRPNAANQLNEDTKINSLHLL